MTPAAIIKQATEDGVNLTVSAVGTIKASGEQAAVTRWLPLIREHKPEIIAVLHEAADGTGPESGRQVFEFSPAANPDDDGALDERAAIIAEGCGIDQAAALQEARWQADRERCWQAFLRNAQRILDAPVHKREGLLARYQAEATGQYGERTGTNMAGSLLAWVKTRTVH